MTRSDFLEPPPSARDRLQQRRVGHPRQIILTVENDPWLETAPFHFDWREVRYPQNFGSRFARTGGTYHNVSKKYLPLYLNEFSFRFNNRENPDIFDAIL